MATAYLRYVDGLGLMATAYLRYVDGLWRSYDSSTHEQLEACPTWTGCANNTEIRGYVLCRAPKTQGE
jgi:hypothetical protein